MTGKLNLRIWLPVLAITIFLTNSSRASFLVGDVNDDNSVDFGDLLLVAEEWLTPSDCLEQGLVGRWKFDETTGTVAADSSRDDRYC